MFFSFFRGVTADCLTYCVCVCYIRWYMIFDIWYVSLYYRWSMLYDLRYVFYDSCYNAYNIFRIHIRNPIKLKKPSVKWKQMHYTLHEITSLRIFCTIPQMKMFNNVYTNSMQSLCKIPSNPITPPALIHSLGLLSPRTRRSPMSPHREKKLCNGGDVCFAFRGFWCDTWLKVDVNK